MLLRKISFVLMCCAICIVGKAQQTLDLSLSEVIILAQSDAPDVLIARTRLSNQYWRYQSFLADYKPQVSLSANNLPFLSRAIEPITQPDGSQLFVDQSLMRNDLNVVMRQQVGATGATVFASTGLERLDLFRGDLPNNITYLSTPISIGFRQPIFQYNEIKWNRKIQPLNYDIAQREYSEDMEQIAFEATQLFFQVLNAQLAVEAATRNNADADTLYNISQGRYAVGRIAETDLLQIELSVRNSEQLLASETLKLQTATNELRDFLGIKEAVNFELLPPYDIPAVEIDAEKALEYALNNRSDVVNYQLRLLEAESQSARAKGNTGLSADIVASFGLSQKGTTIGEAYTNPLDQERITIGFDIPIADWGKTKAILETAKSNEELVRMQVSQDRVNFEREILLKVQQFDLVRNQVSLAERTYEVAQRSNNITRQRYFVGKIGITDLNIALDRQEAARLAYVNALRDFWIAYYDLRSLTLYDFVTDRPLIRGGSEE